MRTNIEKMLTFVCFVLEIVSYRGIHGQGMQVIVLVWCCRCLTLLAFSNCVTALSPFYNLINHFLLLE